MKYILSKYFYSLKSNIFNIWTHLDGKRILKATHLICISVHIWPMITTAQRNVSAAFGDSVVAFKPFVCRIFQKLMITNKK